MKKEIENRDDIYLLVKNFYVKLMNDDELHHFFEEFKNPQLLEKHLQILVDFWENILFYSGGYRNNPMAIHQKLHQTKPINSIHFNRWLSVFNSTVDELFVGENAHAIKSRALSIATVMEIQISKANK